MASGRRHPSRSWVTWTAAVAAICVVAYGSHLGILALRRARALRALPDLPVLVGHNEATETLIRGADRDLRADPLSKERLARMATVYHAHQYYAEAIALYRMLAVRDPRRFRWAYYHGVASEAVDEWVEAAGAFRRAVRIDPDHADTWARLAALLLKMGNVVEGKASAMRAFGLDPDLPMAALAQARLEAWKGNWQGMVDILTLVLEAYPTFSEAHRQIGRAYAMLGEDELAEHHFTVGEYGAEMTSPELEELFALAVPAILDGDAPRGQLLIEDRCVRCHTLERTFYREGRDIRWWAATVRRMQRLAGRDLLRDDEAADVAAFLASQREPDDTITTP